MGKYIKNASKPGGSYLSAVAKAKRGQGVTPQKIGPNAYKTGTGDKRGKQTMGGRVTGGA